nr:protein NLP4-like isoform X2 [Erigeron canadensis]
MYLDPLKGVLQFWAPLKTSCGRLILSTSSQPFTFAYLNSLRHKYRLSSLNYRSTIIDDYTEFQENPKIITGPPATAFLNRFPVVLDLSVHQHDPLVRSALECGLTCSLLLPVFIHPSQTASSCCAGVVECSVKRSGLVIFNQLKTALERVGLSVYHVQESRPYKGIPGLKCATNEIEEALEIVCESHGLTLAQVWIPFEKENEMPSSSSSAENTRMKQKLVVKLIGYLDVSDDNRTLVIQNYYDTCDMLPLKLGEGLAGKTLQNYEPLFCQNLKELSDNGLLGLLSANTKCSCFAICLRNVDTGDLDYAFEFLWPRN